MQILTIFLMSTDFQDKYEVADQYIGIQKMFQKIHNEVLTEYIMKRDQNNVIPSLFNYMEGSGVMMQQDYMDHQDFLEKITNNK